MIFRLPDFGCFQRANHEFGLNILIMPLLIGSDLSRRLLADIGENTAVNIEDMSVDEI